MKGPITVHSKTPTRLTSGSSGTKLILEEGNDEGRVDLEDRQDVVRRRRKADFVIAVGQSGLLLLSRVVLVNAVVMTLEVVLPREALATSRALERPLARVRPDVLGVVLPGEEVLAAELAHVRLDLETINQKLFFKLLLTADSRNSIGKLCIHFSIARLIVQKIVYSMLGRL